MIKKLVLAEIHRRTVEHVKAKERMIDQQILLEERRKQQEKKRQKLMEQAARGGRHMFNAFPKEKVYTEEELAEIYQINPKLKRGFEQLLTANYIIAGHQDGSKSRLKSTNKKTLYEQNPIITPLTKLMLQYDDDYGKLKKKMIQGINSTREPVQEEELHHEETKSERDERIFLARQEELR